MAGTYTAITDSAANLLADAATNGGSGTYSSASSSLLVTLADSSANIAALTNAQLATLASHGVDVIRSTDTGSALTIDVNHLSHLSTVVGGTTYTMTLAATDTVTLVDTGANLATATVAQLAGLAALNVDKVDASDNFIPLTLDQHRALFSSGVTVAANDRDAVTRDFNHDGKGDVLLQNTVDGTVCLWDMSGKTLVSSGTFGWTPGSNWQVKGTGDFDNNGIADVLLQNAINGDCYIWAKANADGAAVSNVLSGKGYIGWTPGPNWQAVGTGDFNGDHYSDVLLQDSATGTCYVWEMNGTSLVGNGYIGWNPGANWKAKGVGDFNGDGLSDVLLQNSNDGTCYIWQSSGSISNGAMSLSGYGYVGWNPGANWVAKGVGDFNGDRKDDIVLQNSNDGSCYIWELNGTGALAGSGYIGWTPGANWQVRATADVNGDGKSDVVLQNVSDGSAYVWELNGPGAPIDSGYIGWTPGSSWVIHA